VKRMKKLFHLASFYFVIITAYGCSPISTLIQSPTPPISQPNVTCNELTFHLDPAFGTNYECKAVPENSESDIPMDIFIYPAHTELTIQDYPLSHTQFPPQILIYPVQRFRELLPKVIPHRVSDLKAFISSGTWGGKELPFLHRFL
jgi:hypothetical protein